MPRQRTISNNTERPPIASRAGQVMARLLLLMIVLPLAFVAIPSAPVAHAAHGAPTGATGQVTILVLDMSGSMAQNDPHGLRCSAADAYISLSRAGQFVGVVGLVGSGTAQVWAQPEEMQTLQVRNQLIQTIASKSNNCAPGGDTPTFDALSKAYDMLAASATGGRTGSVILLTDGVPAPNQDQQTHDIIQQLIPKYAHAGFPINTIALNPQAVSFLHDVSSGTNGSYDDDVNPATGQPDPLEIAPVFLRYFAALTGRTPKPLIKQQPLNGGVTARNFSVSSLVSHLDAIVIKQDPQAVVSLTSPEGIVYTGSTSSVLVAKDPHYAIFSIDGPTAGNWTTTITGGSGDFSVYGLVVTNLHITLTVPTGSRTTFPIDQPVAAQALLTSIDPTTNQTVNVNANYTVKGYLTSGSQVLQLVNFNHVPGSATYAASIALPPGEKPDTYTLTLKVFQGSDDILTASAPRIINFEVFPAPYLVDGSGAQVNSVNTTVTAYDRGLQFIYNHVPPFSWFGEWPFGGPLRGIPATPSAVINGVVTNKGRVYPNASVSGSATQITGTNGGNGSTTSGGAANAAATAATVSNTTVGHFQVVFPVAADGTYNLRLNTSGTYEDSHNASWPTNRQVTLTIKPATVSQEVVAWLVTALYLLILICLSPFIYRWFIRRPGHWSRTIANRTDSGSFYRLLGRPRYLRRWFRPGTVSSGEAWGLPGLMLHWGWFGTSIRPDGPDAAQWRPNQANSVFRNLTYTANARTITIDISRRASRRGRTGSVTGSAGTGGFRSTRTSATSLTGRPTSSTGRSATGRPTGGFKKSR